VTGSGLVLVALAAGLPLPGAGAQGDLPTVGCLLSDPRKCQGCDSCMLACALAHHGRAGLSLARLQVRMEPFGAYPDDVTQQSCLQCPQAPCVQACPTGALRGEAGSVARVDAQACVGCQACLAACHQAPSRMGWNQEEGHAQKCDLCLGAVHWDRSQGLACVNACPLGALVFSDRLPDPGRSAGPAGEARGALEKDLRGRNWRRLGFPRR